MPDGFLFSLQLQVSFYILFVFAVVLTSQLGPAEFGIFAALARCLGLCWHSLLYLGNHFYTRKFDNIDNRAENFKC